MTRLFYNIHTLHPFHWPFPRAFGESARHNQRFRREGLPDRRAPPVNEQATEIIRAVVFEKLPIDEMYFDSSRDRALQFLDVAANALALYIVDKLSLAGGTAGLDASAVETVFERVIRYLRAKDSEWWFKREVLKKSISTYILDEARKRAVVARLTRCFAVLVEGGAASLGFLSQ